VAQKIITKKIEFEEKTSQGSREPKEGVAHPGVVPRGGIMVCMIDLVMSGMIRSFGCGETRKMSRTKPLMPRAQHNPNTGTIENNRKQTTGCRSSVHLCEYSSSRLVWYLRQSSILSKFTRYQDLIHNKKTSHSTSFDPVTPIY